jgi:hypothetical protein
VCLRGCTRSHHEEAYSRCAREGVLGLITRCLLEKVYSVSPRTRSHHEGVWSVSARGVLEEVYSVSGSARLITRRNVSGFAVSTRRTNRSDLGLAVYNKDQR